MAKDVFVMATFPDGADEKGYLAAVRTVVEEYGGTIVDDRSSDYSPELEAFGLGRQLNIALACGGIRTSTALYRLTWRELVCRRFPGIQYGRLLRIVRAGAAKDPPMVLRGVTVPAEEQIEIMPWNPALPRAYKAVKLAGINTRGQLLALDVVGIRKVAPRHLGTVLGVIRLAHSRPHALWPGRTIADLGFAKFRRWGLVGYDHIGYLTVDILRARIAATGKVPADGVENELEALLEEFRREWFTEIPNLRNVGSKRCAPQSPLRHLPVGAASL